MRSHQHLFVWQRANLQALQVHRFCDATWRPPRAAVIDQLRRSSLSVMLNITEGHAFGPGRRCLFHARIAYGSAVETTAILDFMASLECGSQSLNSGSREVEALVMRWILSLKR